MKRYIFPAVILVSLILIWLGTATVNAMPAISVDVAVPSKNVATEAVAAVVEVDEVIAVESTPSACTISTKYPQSVQQWCGLIAAAAERYDLSADLIAAVILRESNGDPVAYSHSGAVGLMQVMPRDGLAAGFQCPNGACFAARPSIAELQDAAFNVDFGSNMLAALLAETGSLREALFHYGPMDVGYTYADLILRTVENHQ